MSDINLKIRVDDSELDESKQALASFATNIRRVAEVSLSFAEAFGTSIDVVLRLAVESGLRIIEFIATAFAVESIATLGIAGALRLSAQAGAIALMIAQINALITQRADSAKRLSYATTALRVMTFMILPSLRTIELIAAYLIGLIIWLVRYI